MKFALDTNILLYFLEGIPPYASRAENLLNSFMRRKNEGVISTVSVAEVLTGFYLVKEEKRATKTKSLLQDLTRNGFEIVPVTFQIADLAAHLKARRGGRLPDALIAATAIDQGANLIYSQDEGLKRFSEEIQVSKLK